MPKNHPLDREKTPFCELNHFTVPVGITTLQMFKQHNDTLRRSDDSRNGHLA
jgi:hypothetical protein